MAKNDFQYGGQNYYTMQCGTIMTLILPGDCTLQRGRWLWDDMPWNSPKRPPYWNSTSILTISPQSTCHSAPVCKILSKSYHPQQTKMSCRFSIKTADPAILDFRGPIMSSLKSPCTTSYRQSIDTIALNWLVFEKIASLEFGDKQTNKQTYRQTNRWTRPWHEAALSLCRDRWLDNSVGFYARYPSCVTGSAVRPSVCPSHSGTPSSVD